MALQIEILTPQKTLFKDEADEVVAPSVNGEVGILPQHTEYLTLLRDGEIRVAVKGGAASIFPIAGGFLSVSSDRVTILADEASGSKDVTP